MGVHSPNSWSPSGLIPASIITPTHLCPYQRIVIIINPFEAQYA